MTSRLGGVAEFLRRAKRPCPTGALVDAIAANPKAGISLGGSLREVRIAREGGGRSGGYRTIYVFGGRDLPIFLVTGFAKNEKDNLSRVEQAELITLSKALLGHFGDGL